MSNQLGFDPVATLEIIKRGITGEPAMTAMNMAIAALRSTRNWIPCAEGLPESGLRNSDGSPKTYRVTVVDHNGLPLPIVYQCDATYEYDTWEMESSYEFEDWETVTAWFELPEPYNPDHIGDANKKVDQFRQPAKKISEELAPCKDCGCNYIITWEHHCITPHRFYCQCAKCKQKTSEHENKELAKQEWNKMQEDVQK